MRMNWTRHVARSVQIRSEYRIFVVKPEKERKRVIYLDIKTG
jgi:hypothetical protein